MNIVISKIRPYSPVIGVVWCAVWYKVHPCCIRGGVYVCRRRWSGVRWWMVGSGSGSGGGSDGLCRGCGCVTRHTAAGERRLQPPHARAHHHSDTVTHSCVVLCCVVTNLTWSQYTALHYTTLLLAALLRRYAATTLLHGPPPRMKPVTANYHRHDTTTPLPLHTTSGR